MKNNLWARIIIMVLMVIIIGLSSFATYRVMMSENNNQLNDADNNQINNNEVTESKLLSIINNELAVLDKHNNIVQLTNQDKLDVAVKSLCKNIYYCSDVNNNYINSFSSTDLFNAYNKTSLAKYSYNNESIKCPVVNYEHDTWKYDSKNKRYTYAEEGHGTVTINVAYKKVRSFTNSNNQYKISIKYAWYKNSLSEGPEDVYAYATYNDAKNNTNSIYMINAQRVAEINYNVEKEFSKYIDDNYETYKDKMDTYNYVFEQKDNQLYLVDFSVN